MDRGSKNVWLRHLLNFACAFAGVLGMALVGGHVVAQGNSSPGIPPRPDDPKAAKAYGVFDTYCARCHQAGRLERPLASGGLANILSIDEQARDPVLVKPGIPDASRLYDVL